MAVLFGLQVGYGPPAEGVGTVLVRTQPPGMEVLLDGASLGPAPIERSLEPGRHEIRAEVPGVAGASTSVSLRPDQEEEITLVLRRPAPYTAWGHAAFWTGVGLTALGGLSAYLAHREAEGWMATDAAGKDRSRAWAAVMLTGFGAGLTLMATGVVLWLYQPAYQGEAAPMPIGVSPTTDGSGAVVTAAGRF
jgi:hypothetical protein